MTDAPAEHSYWACGGYCGADHAPAERRDMSELDKTRSCVFCDKIAAHDYAERYTTAKHPYADVVRFEPLGPVVPGHMLFVPVSHRATASEDPWLAGRTFACAASFGFVQAQPYNLITSAGEDATQSVFHLHVHYVPRVEGDGLKLPWTGQVKNG